jgi:MFS family permease
MDITALTMGPWKVFWTKIVAFLPGFFAAIIILVLGWMIAKLAKAGVVKLLKFLHFEKATDKAGIKDLLIKGDIRETPSDLIGILIYWLVMLLVLTIALNTLGLQTVSELFNQILLYIPNVVAAVVVLILGIFFANFLRGIVATACSNAGVPQADGLGKLTLYAIVVFTAALALNQLGIASEIVSQAFILIFGALCLALGLAFGLGGKEIAAHYLDKWLKTPEGPNQD